MIIENLDTSSKTEEKEVTTLEAPGTTTATESNISEQPDKVDNVNDSKEIQSFETTQSLEEMESQLQKQKDLLEGKGTDQSNNVKDTEGKTPDSQITKENKHLVKIDKDYIAKQPAEHQEILNSLLGKLDYRLSDADLLKSHINAQIKIRSDAAEIEKLKQEKQVPEFTQKDTDQISVLTTQLVEQELKNSYPDFPGLNDKEALKYWIAEKLEEDPFFTVEFREQRTKLETDFRKEAENEVMLTNNWQRMAQMQTEKEIAEFENYIKQKGLTIADLGVDPKSEDFVRSILFKENKNNPQVIQMYKGRIPVVQNGSVLNLLRDRFYDRIIELREIKARQEAFSKKEALKPNPGMSASAVAGKVTDTDKAGAEVRRFSGDESFEAIEQELQRQKEKIGIPGTSIS